MPANGRKSGVAVLDWLGASCWVGRVLVRLIDGSGFSGVVLQPPNNNSDRPKARRLRKEMVKIMLSSFIKAAAVFIGFGQTHFVIIEGCVFGAQFDHQADFVA